ncbi:MAG: putative Ig domain-containing protein [bacterium]|nr:putative Ig domain-containing protein [bacterium]
MTIRLTALCFFLLFFLFHIQNADARPFRPGLLPNGNVNSCANCHVDPDGGGPRNAFGQAVESRVSPNGLEAFWGPALAALDSDGDGFTNGQELGDPNGTGTATLGAQVTNPGDRNSVPQIVNRAPVLGALGAQSVKEGEALTFTVQATDEDNDTVTFTAANLPEGATFSGNTFTWTPTFDQGGVYSISVTASDGTDQASMSVAVTVENVARPLVISAFSPARGTLLGMPGDMLTVSVSASSPDALALTYTWTINGQAQVETGPSLLVTASSGDADDAVSVQVSDGTATLTRSWTVGKRLMGDLNSDNQVNFADFLDLVTAFGKASGEDGFNAAADLDANSRVEFADFLIFARYFGLSSP